MMALRLMTAFIRKDWLERTSYRGPFLMSLVGIVVGLCFFKWSSELFAERFADMAERYQGNLFAFLVLGIGVYSYSQAALGELTRIIRTSQVVGTLEAMLATPAPLWMVLLALPGFTMLWLTLRVALYFALGIALFGMSVDFGNWPLALLIFALTVASFGVLGVALAGLTIAFKGTERLAGVVSAVFLLLGGVFIPPEALPEPFRVVARLLPITHGLEGLRGALMEDLGWRGASGSIAALAMFVAAGTPIALLVVRWSIRRAKRDGTLTQY